MMAIDTFIGIRSRVMTDALDSSGMASAFKEEIDG
jgi:hypothetical protein